MREKGKEFVRGVYPVSFAWSGIVCHGDALVCTNNVSW